VGVAADVRQQGLIAPVKPQVFLPHAQLPFGAMSVVVRTTLDPAGFAPSIRGIVHSLDNSLPVGAIRTTGELVDDVLRGRRATMTVLELFGALALGLAAMGIYGVVSVSTTQRTKEIGIRIALGAGRGAVLKLIFSQGVGMIATGLALGLAGALSATRLLGSMLFEISPADPATYIAVIAILAFAALAGTLVPALRATRVDPSTVLRQE
jgi:putative ABC transport system permease protein